MGIKSNVKKIIKAFPGIKGITLRYRDLKLSIQENTALLNTILEREQALSEMIVKTQDTILRSIANKEWSEILHGELTNERIAVYTVIIGDYDSLRQPKVKDLNCDYYCLTDNPELKSDFWNIIQINRNDYAEKCYGDNTRINRYLKLHPHEIFSKYKYTLYLDSNIYIDQSIIVFLYLYWTGKDLLVYKHPERICLYHEADFCKAVGKDDINTIDRQIERYKREGFPKDYGLTMGSVLFRRNSQEMIEFDEAWWSEIENGSKRDQLSFMYVCWKKKFSFDICPNNIFNDDIFGYSLHKNMQTDASNKIKYNRNY